MNQGVIQVKGKTAVLLAYVLLVVCLAFTLGYLLGVNKGETQIRVSTVQAAPTTAAAPAETAAEEPAAQTPSEETPIDLNTATQAQLELLPGVGPELAKRIIAYREEYGRFVAKEQLMDVEGIGEKRYASLEPLITVGTP